MIIEIDTFRLASGVDEAAFLDVDTRVQAELHRMPEAVIRRTTARRDDGTWLVLTFWWEEPPADLGPASAELASMIDASTRRVERFTSLD